MPVIKPSSKRLWGGEMLRTTMRGTVLCFGTLSVYWGWGHWGDDEGKAAEAFIGRKTCVREGDAWVLISSAGDCQPMLLASARCETTTTNASYRIKMRYAQLGIEGVTITWITGTSEEPTVNPADLHMRRGRLAQQPDSTQWMCSGNPPGEAKKPAEMVPQDAGTFVAPDSSTYDVWAFVPDNNGNVVLLNSIPGRTVAFTLPIPAEEGTR
jgi:hypothetical protein